MKTYLAQSELCGTEKHHLRKNFLRQRRGSVSLLNTFFDLWAKVARWGALVMIYCPQLIKILLSSVPPLWKIPSLPWKPTLILFLSLFTTLNALLHLLLLIFRDAPWGKGESGGWKKFIKREENRSHLQPPTVHTFLLPWNSVFQQLLVCLWLQHRDVGSNAVEGSGHVFRGVVMCSPQLHNMTDFTCYFNTGTVQSELSKVN